VELVDYLFTSAKQLNYLCRRLTLIAIVELDAGANQLFICQIRITRSQMPKAVQSTTATTIKERKKE